MNTLLSTTIAANSASMKLPAAVPMIASITGTTTYAATVALDVSFDETVWVQLATVTINQTSDAGILYDETMGNYTYQRIRVHTVTGTITEIKVVTE
jgi:hypothetical protein